MITLTAREREILINALDQYITNSEEDQSDIAEAERLLERLQLQKLKELGV